MPGKQDGASFSGLYEYQILKSVTSDNNHLYRMSTPLVLYKGVPFVIITSLFKLPYTTFGSTMQRQWLMYFRSSERATSIRL